MLEFRPPPPLADDCSESSGRQGTERSSRLRRGDSGLTTLEWLLIVAAVAGLAALAVVLVSNVVGDTAEQISDNNARKTAATLAAQEVIDDAYRNAADQPEDANTWGEWTPYYTAKCELLGITYADAGITATANFLRTGNSQVTPGDPNEEAISTGRMNVVGPTDPNPGTPTVQGHRMVNVYCGIS